MRIFTSRYYFKGLNERPDLVKVQISCGFPRFPTGYRIDAAIPELMPSGGIMYIKDREAYWQQYRDRRLQAAGVEKLREIFRRLAGEYDIVLLCFEDLKKPGECCHRRMFAEWWIEQTGERVEELELMAEGAP